MSLMLVVCFMTLVTGCSSSQSEGWQAMNKWCELAIPAYQEYVTNDAKLDDVTREAIKASAHEALLLTREAIKPK
jgi:hypothetical protein